jgi:hypothetical protein
MADAQSENLIIDSYPSKKWTKGGLSSKGIAGINIWQLGEGRGKRQDKHTAFIPYPN